MRPPINFRDKSTTFNAENVGINFDWICQQIESRTGTTIVKAVTSAVSSSSGGGSAPKFDYRFGQVSVSSGAVTITFSSAMPTTDYKVIAFLIDSDGATTLLKAPTTKALGSMTYTFDFSGTLIYFVAPTQ